MIIGEHNLIIGKKFSIISNFSISLFFYIKKQINFLDKLLLIILIRVEQSNKSPPI